MEDCALVFGAIHGADGVDAAAVDRPFRWPATRNLRTLRVEADPGILVGEVAVQDVSRSEALSSRESELEARIEALKDEKAALGPRELDRGSQEHVNQFL